MRYISTRGGAAVSFQTALFEGMPQDGGLRMPAHLPTIDLANIRRHKESYARIAYAVLSVFIDDISHNDLWRIIRATYTSDAFGSSDIVPVKMLEPRFGLLQLSRGRTHAFKDIALRFVANVMEHFLKQSGERRIILGATSGDTGSATEDAFAHRANIDVVMLSPYGRMSPVQAAQMYSNDAHNIHNLALDGVFDEEQALCKAIMEDAAFSALFNISAVNSINWARIAAQVVYYFVGYVRATTHNAQRVTFVVPTGNFGDVFAGCIARAMGLPISLVAATNENDVVHQYYQTGVYRPRSKDAVVGTSSPSMDIAIASNFERWVFMRHGCDANAVRTRWEHIKQHGYFQDEETHPGEGWGITSGVATERDVINAMRLVYQTHKEVVDPHTAVGVHVALSHKRATSDEVVLVNETALPLKFEATVREALGDRVANEVCGGTAALLARPQRCTRGPVDIEFVKDYIRSIATRAA